MDDQCFQVLAWRRRSGDPVALDSWGCSRCHQTDTQASSSAVCQKGERRIASRKTDLWSGSRARRDGLRDSPSGERLGEKDSAHRRSGLIVAESLAKRTGARIVRRRAPAAGVTRYAGRGRWRARNFRMVMKTPQPDELELSEEGYSCQKVAEESSRAPKAAAVAGPRRSNSEAKLLHSLDTLPRPSESLDLLL